MIIFAILGYEETDLCVNFHIDGLKAKLWGIIMVVFNSPEVEEDVGYANLYCYYIIYNLHIGITPGASNFLTLIQFLFPVYITLCHINPTWRPSIGAPCHV